MNTPIQTKLCPKCCLDLPHTKFYKNKGKRFGLSLWCADCMRAASAAYRKRCKNNLAPGKCQDCQKPLKTSSPRCNLCALIQKRKTHVERQRKAAKSRVKSDKKTCPMCKKEQSLANFSDDKRRLDGKNSNCKQCCHYMGYVSNAKRKSKQCVWELSRKEFNTLLLKNCKYCGKSKANGIDRVDNARGYTVDNVASCCEICNAMKLDYTLEFWTEHMKKIVKHLSKP